MGDFTTAGEVESVTAHEVINTITDADAKLMKNKNGFTAAYNPQTAVDSETHLIRDFQMTNRVTDHGLLESSMEEVKKAEPEKIAEAVADRGYEDTEDMVRCLEKGIIPHVITDGGKDGYEIEIPYEKAEADVTSTNPEELKKALHAGEIPEAYTSVIQDMKVETVRRKGSDEKPEKSSVYGSQEEMLEKAKTGYFVRDPERNLVYCPSGEILRRKCIKKNGNIRYANKNACRHCPNRNKCYKGKGEWKEIDFTKDQLQKPCKEWLKAEGKEPEEAKSKEKWHYEKKKVVKFFLKPDQEKTKRRMSLVLKRLKSLLGLGSIPTKTKEAGETWINGKMLLSLLTENILGILIFPPLGTSEANWSIWRETKLVSFIIFMMILSNIQTMSLDILELVKIAFIKKRKHTRQQLLCFCKISAYGDSMTKKDTKLENLSKTVHMLIEEIRLSETEGLDRIFMDVYSQQADMMTDSRAK